LKGSQTPFLCPECGSPVRLAPCLHGEGEELVCTRCGLVLNEEEAITRRERRKRIKEEAIQRWIEEVEQLVKLYGRDAAAQILMAKPRFSRTRRLPG